MPSHLSPLTNCVCLLSAVCFKNAKQYEQAKDAYLKEAEYHTENKTYPICDRSKVDCHDIWLCFVISLTYPTDFFMLPSKCLLYYPSNYTEHQTKNPHVLLKLSLLSTGLSSRRGWWWRWVCPQFKQSIWLVGAGDDMGVIILLCLHFNRSKRRCQKPSST